MTHPKCTFTRSRRRWWYTNLGGYPDAHAGLLYTKVNGRWVRNNVLHKDRPWRIVRRQPIGRFNR